MTTKRFASFFLLILVAFYGCDSSTGPTTEVDAVLTMLPASGHTGTDFSFNAGGSSSTAKTPSLEFRWDWEDDGSWDESWSSTSTSTHAFDDPGAYTVRVEVRDRNATDQATISLNVDPEVFALLEVSPEEGTVLTDFEFDASASTSSSPGLSSLDYRWDLDADGTYDTDWTSESTVTTRFEAGVGYPQVRVEVRDAGGVSDAVAQVTLNGNHGQIVDSLFVDQAIIPSGMTYDGEHFWFSQWGPDETLVQVSSETGDILKSFPAHSNWTGGLTWDGTHLWQQSIIGGSVIIEIDPDDGATLSNMPVIYSKGSSGLCWTGEAFFWGNMEKVGVGGDDKIHKYDKSGTELLVFDPPGGAEYPDALACDSEALFVVGRGVNEVFSVDPTSGASLYSWGRWGGPLMTIAEGYLWVWGYWDNRPLIRKIVP